MASTSDIIKTMNNITLKDEEEGGLAIEIEDGVENAEPYQGYNAKLCLMGRFLSEGVVDFQAMKQTLTALWRPCRGCIYEK